MKSSLEQMIQHRLQFITLSTMQGILSVTFITLMSSPQIVCQENNEWNGLHMILLFNSVYGAVSVTQILYFILWVLLLMLLCYYLVIFTNVMIFQTIVLHMIKI